MSDVVWRLTSEQVDRLRAFFSESAAAGVFDYDDGGVLLDTVNELEMLVAQRDQYQSLLQAMLPEIERGSHYWKSYAEGGDG